MAETTEKIIPRLQQRYQDEIIPVLKKELGRDNVMSLPKLQKIVLNMGVGQASQDRKLIDGAVRDMTVVAGQKPLICNSRRAVSGFRLRENMPVGVKVTLRGARMYEFLDRLISVVIPRIRDFRGLNPRSFDGQGNYGMGLDDQFVFPEIDADEVGFAQGMDICMVIQNAQGPDEGRLLLKQFGMPFRQSS